MGIKFRADLNSGVREFFKIAKNAKFKTREIKYQ